MLMHERRLQLKLIHLQTISTSVMGTISAKVNHGELNEQKFTVPAEGV
jgi:hypothetical protein